MKRILLASAIFVGLSGSIPADAQLATVCTNCSTIAEQLMSDARQAQQYLTQVAALQTDLRQYANMIQNTVALPQEIFANVQGDIFQVRNLANAGSLLTGNAGSILTRLQGLSSYSSSVPNVGQQFAMWRQTIGNAENSMARTLGVQQGQEESYTALQYAIQAHSQTAAGQMQAIQAGNEALGLMNSQMQQVQTSLVTMAQEQATTDEVNADRRAEEDQSMLQFSQFQQVPTTGYQGF